jgi:uncharacterized protein with ParB-like and HNH nuclease domain
MEAIFETNPVFLSSLLGDLKIGKIQLPDFQRGWVWDDERIRGVLASVSRSFPIGALMVLETGGETRFHPRSKVSTCRKRSNRNCSFSMGNSA